MAHLRQLLAALPLAATFIAASAQAQDKNITTYVPEEEIKQIENEKRQGWDGTLSVSATVNLVSNDNVVGQTDGVSTLFGLGLLSGLDYVWGKHEIRNTLKISEAFARTPVVSAFVKSDDVLDVESLYNYFFVKWVGAFGRLNVETAVFKSEQITADPIDYEITDQNGDVTSTTSERLPLADNLQPFTFNQSVGLFAEPVQTTPFNLSTRLGLGFRETWAQGVYVISDDAATEALVEVKDITNPDSGLTIFQGGIEGFVGLSGSLKDKRVAYEVGGTVLVPFVNNDPQDRGAGELTRVGGVVNIAFSVFEWMSINYKLRAIRDPQLVDGLQLQNNLLLTFKYTFIERTEPEAPPEPSKADTEAEDAKKRADAAEKRAAEAEAKAAELEKKLADQVVEPQPEPPPTPEPQPTPEPTPEPAPEPQP